MYYLSKPQKLIYDMEKYAGGAVSVICGSMLIKDTKNVSELKQAATKLYRLNDALRIHIIESNEGVQQEIREFIPCDTETLFFESKEQLDLYGEGRAKEPMDLYGPLCELKIVLLKDSCGFFVKLHHIIGDAWTLSLLGTQANAVLSGETPIAYSYTEYLDREKIYMQSSRHIKDRAFFMEQFKECNEVTYLSEKQNSSLRSNRKTFVIKGEEANSVISYTKNHGVSPFMLFMTTVAAYISRVRMNVEKFYIGTAVLNRTGIQEKNTVGMFINTVPVQINLDNSASFAENLSKVKKASLSVFRHQKYNYGDVLVDIRKEYGFAEKLYDVMFSYQNATITGADGAMESTWYHSGSQTESLQIHIDDRDREGIFRIHYDYQVEKFSEAEIEQMHQRITSLLLDAVANDGKKLCELEILPEAEKRTLLVDFNNTAVDYPWDKCVHTLFEEQAERTPDKTAVIACDKTLTYRELNEQANRIAHSLIKQGIRVGDIVAFALPRRSYLIATMFGILKAGAAYLPVDPDYPQDRIDYMLQDSLAKLLITEETIANLLTNDHADNPVIAQSNKSLCYCIYTSGTTGKPKGTLIRHRNVVNFVQSNNVSDFQKSILNCCEYFIATNSVSFDITLQEIHLPLLNGRSSILLSDEQAYNIGKSVHLLKGKRCGLIITPTKLEIYMADQAFCDSLHDVAFIMCGAESFPQQLRQQIRKYTNAVIFNGYGPTETTCGVLYSNTADGTDITIGKPIANTQIYIVDRNMQLVPIGVTGELCIAGDGVGAGYLNRPELTAEKFIDNPFGEGKLYKTGDLAYWREDGNIVYVGRNDFQVKIRGLRIELGEIENTISSVNGVSQAVVVVRKDDTGRQLICAFYTENAPVAVGEIKAAIQKRLPRYMMPHIFMRLSQLPLTPSGKFNRKGLPEVDLSSIATTVEYVAPQTPTEEKLSAIWGQLLKIDRVGRTDDFFELGGDSLLSISLLSKLESGFDVTVSIKDIFEHPVLKQFAEFLDHAQNHQKKIVATGAQRYALLPQQMAIYAACSKNPQSLAYNMPTKFVWKDGIDKEQLKTCLLRLLELHPELNASIRSDDGVVYATYEADAGIVFEEYEEENARDFVRPFDLEKAPLVRVGFTKDELLFDIHHIIADGESVNIILRDLAALYAGAELEKSEFTYADHAAYFHAADFSEHKAYFKNLLKCDFEPLFLPEKGRKDRDGGASLLYQIDKAAFKKGRGIARANKMTDTMVFLGAFGILLSKYTARTDILSSVVVTNRVHKEVQGVTGMFVNTLPVMLPVEGSTADYLAYVRDLMLNLYQYQELPFFEIAEAVGMNDKNVVNTSFVYQADGAKQVTIGEKQLTPTWIDTHAAKFDLTFELTPNENGCAVRIEYNSGKYEKDLIDRLFEGYLHVIDQLSKKELKDISVLSDAEYQKVVYDFNDTAVDYPRNKCVYELFVEQAHRTPEKTALLLKNSKFTYQELDKITNGLALSMRGLGIRPGDRVAVLLERDEKVIFAQIAALKIGAVFIPIDNRYPKDRIEYILAESEAKVIIKNGSTDLAIAKARNIEDLDLSPVECMEYPCVDAENACYIIFTSGSTGQPKGCTLTNRGLVNFCRNNNILAICNQLNRQVCISVNTISFDFFIAESLLPLSNGYTVVLASEEESVNRERFIDLAVSTGANIIQTTPTRFKLYCDEKHDLSYMWQFDVIVTSGEALPLELLSIFRKNSNAKIFNPLGPSECSVWVAGGELHLTNREVADSDITVGRPIANTQIYILDKHRQPVPIGVAGELCISGDGVGMGYLNRPELTAEKFIPNPFIPGKTMYCTGDLARWRTDGEIEYLGRIDTQVKIRGLRIELNEIESIMSSFDGISLTAVADKRDETGRQYLVGYYTAERTIDETALRQHLSTKLPKYMVPNYFVRLDEMPMTPSGKTDRKNLPAPEFASQAREYIPPKTEQEKILCNVLSKLFNMESVGITDDFFELGGDSLRAIEYTAKAHHAGVSFSLQNVFDYPTVESLCKYLQAWPSKETIFTAEQFQKYAPILQKNTWNPDFIPQHCEIGSVLLTGATGFLGAHILDALMKHGVRKVYCLVRGSEEKLVQRLNYYFGGQYVNSVGTSIIPVIGDLEDERVTDSLPKRVDYVIHAAASVKHYGSWQYFKSINVDGTKRIVAYAKKVGARLVHISTISVSGNAGADQMDMYVSEEEKYFYESSLYIGQPLDNVYIRSKFEAEMLVLDAVLEGLQANIIRVGNLTNRKSDLKFQPNYMENAFLTRVKAMLSLGCLPDYLMPLYSEFSPVDSTAEAIITIVEHFNDQYTVFHVNSDRNLYFDRMMAYLERLGRPMKIVSGEQFVKRIRDTIDSQQSYVYEALSNDLDEEDQLQYDTHIHIENEFTVQYLKSLGFQWPKIDYAYVEGYLQYFEQLGHIGGAVYDAE